MNRSIQLSVHGQAGTLIRPLHVGRLECPHTFLASTGSLTNAFRYTGREFDLETSLYYYRARYYDSNAGKFITEDPTGFKAGSNFYRYAKNNTVNIVDPFGLNPGTVTLPWILGNPIVRVAPWVRAVSGAIGLFLGELAFPDATGIDDGRAIPKPKPTPPCDKDKVRCWLSGEFKDPSIDSKFKMCSYSCSDGSARVYVIHIGLPCPPTPDRLPQ